jgi:hypothetical protein
MYLSLSAYVLFVSAKYICVVHYWLSTLWLIRCRLVWAKHPIEHWDANLEFCSEVWQSNLTVHFAICIVPNLQSTRHILPNWKPWSINFTYKESVEFRNCQILIDDLYKRTRELVTTNISLRPFLWLLIILNIFLKKHSITQTLTNMHVTPMNARTYTLYPYEHSSNKLLIESIPFSIC